MNNETILLYTVSNAVIIYKLVFFFKRKHILAHFSFLS